MDVYADFMRTLIELEHQALELPENERAVLAAHLLSSLPACLSEEDEGVAEALRRERELDRNPAAGISFDELKSSLKPVR